MTKHKRKIMNLFEADTAYQGNTALYKYEGNGEDFIESEFINLS